MIQLTEIEKGVRLSGLLPSGPVKVVSADMTGQAMNIFYLDSSGRPGTQLLYRSDLDGLDIVPDSSPWRPDLEGEYLKLALEAYRIRLAHLFDPMLAVHTSMIDPLPHQITAVYGEMLTRQPLRYLLADDPGAGKTIMAGLLIKELMIRGDLQRCLVCCPGNLAEQWQDELQERFGLRFVIVSNQTVEDSRSGNPYAENDLVISRLDHMSRNDRIRSMVEQSEEWDLVVVDEAHKMSAHLYGSEVKETGRYQLGKMLGSPSRTRHFLLMTATPHNGHDEDFNLFMRLLDPERFEGRAGGQGTGDVSDIMRRMVKEQLVTFEGTPLFPERRAYTVSYALSPDEELLYGSVTNYVRDEMNRADRILKDDGKARNVVGFALTTLQRRLASSPEAIYQSLQRRCKRLEERVAQIEANPGAALSPAPLVIASVLPEDEEGQPDLDDATDDEIEQFQQSAVEQASTATTLGELKQEIRTLKGLVSLAERVRNSGTDRKWEELSRLLQDNPEMRDSNGGRRKLIVFTEHRDTLNYLCGRIRAMIGQDEAVVVIHGGVNRDERRRTQESFTQDPDVRVLIATDAAGEGINLQRAHLIVNYDLPWNPNRLEQRFGRIHRIGQTEVCHMWSLVAAGTREGDVFLRLLSKLEAEKAALGAGVFDVLGSVFSGDDLRGLLIEAIRYGEQPEVRDRLFRRVDSALDTGHLRELLEKRALAGEAMDPGRVTAIRDDMERAEARRLQPHYIASFFRRAFALLGGSCHEREPGRWEVPHVPSQLRTAFRPRGSRAVLSRKYERICFDKNRIRLQGRPPADFVCPGHPLLESVIDVILDRYSYLFAEGAILVDTKPGEGMRALFPVKLTLMDGFYGRDGSRRVVAERVEFVDVGEHSAPRDAGAAPHLDFRPLHEGEREAAARLLARTSIGDGLDGVVSNYAADSLVPGFVEEEGGRRKALARKTEQAVRERLLREINYWEKRAIELREQERAGKPNDRLNSDKAMKRADDLRIRMERRIEDLARERTVTPKPPHITGRILVVPEAMLAETPDPDLIEHARRTAEVERLAMEAVIRAERESGFEPRDVSAEKVGYDVESRDPSTGRLRFVEVKGRIEGAETITVTRNEILTCLNKPDRFWLAIVKVSDGVPSEPVYLKAPFTKEPDFGVTSVNYGIHGLLERAETPQ